MTLKKRLKQKLARLKTYRTSLPHLIKLSGLNGDDYYDEEDIRRTDEEITDLEETIKNLDYESYKN